MSSVKNRLILEVTSAGLFLLIVSMPHGQTHAQVFFVQGETGRDGVCQPVVNTDLTVTGRLEVHGAHDLGDCPSGYERDPSAHPSIVVCIHPTSGDEMVKVGDFWADRYEMAVLANPDCTGVPLGGTSNDWAARAPDFPSNGNWITKLYACSIPGVNPSRFMTWFRAQAACAASGKRLCTNEEWQAASQGTYDPGGYDGSAGGACHTSGSASRVTGDAGTEPGATTSCISRWGAEDMIGNLNEWVGTWHAHTGWNGALNFFTTGYGEDVYYSGSRVYTDMNNYGSNSSWRPSHPGMIAGAGNQNGEYFGPASLKRGGGVGSGTSAGTFALNMNHGAGQQGGARCCRQR